MNGEVIRLGRSLQVTLTSHEVARLAEISGLIRYFLDPDLRIRWSEPLHFPEDFDRLKYRTGIRDYALIPVLYFNHFIAK